MRRSGGRAGDDAGLARLLRRPRAGRRAGGARTGYARPGRYQPRSGSSTATVRVGLSGRRARAVRRRGLGCAEGRRPGHRGLRGAARARGDHGRRDAGGLPGRRHQVPRHRRHRRRAPRIRRQPGHIRRPAADRAHPGGRGLLGRQVDPGRPGDRRTAGDARGPGARLADAPRCRCSTAPRAGPPVSAVVTTRGEAADVARRALAAERRRRAAAGPAACRAGWTSSRSWPRPSSGYSVTGVTGQAVTPAVLALVEELSDGPQRRGQPAAHRRQRRAGRRGGRGLRRGAGGHRPLTRGSAPARPCRTTRRPAG